MKTLAIDTSNQTMALAIMEDETMIAQLQTTVNKNHSRSLLPAIDFLMTSVGMQATDLEQIAVAKGPGSYTGLRIGVTTAKTLAQTLAIPLRSVSSLAVLAGNPEVTTGVIVPIMDARRQNVYTGSYRYESGQLTVVTTDRHVALDAWLAELAATNIEPIVFTGKDALLFKEQILAVLPKARFDATEQSRYPSGVVLAQLAQTMGTLESATHFVPSYLKKVEAEEKWLETHQESAEAYVEKI